MKNTNSIKNFDILEDRNNYYFFRALNKKDNEDLENGIITNNKGKIIKIRTDRERYQEKTKYNKNSKLTLEEIYDHIKPHHRTDTNCISLTTNANVALLYGREYYKDCYILIKTPKKEINKKVFNASQYMTKEINKIIDSLTKNNNIDTITKNCLHKIDKCKTRKELIKLINNINKEKNKIKTQNNNSIIYYKKNDTTVIFQSLEESQNLEKEKLISKLRIIKQDIISNTSNYDLEKTIENAYDSLEFIHYNSIPKKKIIEVPKEIIDILAIIQQLPKESKEIKNLKKELLKIIKTKKENIKEFNYHNKNLDLENKYTIENIYNLTQGKIEYSHAINIYKKSYYLSKSKLRTKEMLDVLKNILKNKNKYKNIFKQLEKHSYGVEPKIFSKQDSEKLKINKYVNLDFNQNEIELFHLINKLNKKDLKAIINNPNKKYKYILNNLKNISYKNITKEEYYADAIIEIFDWTKIDIASISKNLKHKLKQKLIHNNILKNYEYLKEKTIKEQEIANLLLTSILKEQNIKDINKDEIITKKDIENLIKDITKQ